MLTAVERFLSRVDLDGPTMPHMATPCWTWTGGKAGGRYGGLYVDGVKWLSHVYAFFLMFGRKPDGVLCHQCDNTLCCNPTHTIDATQSRNLRDAYERRRRAPMTSEQARRMRAAHRERTDTPVAA